MSGEVDFPLKVIKQAVKKKDHFLIEVAKELGAKGLRGIKEFKIPDPYVKPEMFKIISEHHPIEEPITLQDLKDKWRGKVNGWLIESAWLIVGRDAGRADAALEVLLEDREK